jgi:hypothetical protein
MDSEDNIFTSEEWKGCLAQRERVAREFVGHMRARVFCVRMSRGGRKNDNYYLHRNKTVSQWRQDIRNYCSASEAGKEGCQTGGDVETAFNCYLENLGYIEVHELVADLWQGKVIEDGQQARMTDDKDQEDWPDGFILHMGD